MGHAFASVRFSLTDQSTLRQTTQVDNKFRKNRHNTNDMAELPQASAQTLQVALCDVRPVPPAGPWQPCSSCKGNCGLPNVCWRSTAMQAQLLSSSGRRPLTHGCSVPARSARLSARSAAPDTHSAVFSRHVKHETAPPGASKLQLQLTVDFGAGASLV